MIDGYSSVPIRLRAKVGYIEETPKGMSHLQGKWVFTVWVTKLDGSDAKEVGTFGPFDSKAVAEKESRKATVQMSKTVSEEFAGKGKGSAMIYDINKGGKLRNPIDFIERG